MKTSLLALLVLAVCGKIRLIEAVESKEPEPFGIVRDVGDASSDNATETLSLSCPPCIEERHLEHYRQKDCVSIFNETACGSECPVRYDCSKYNARHQVPGTILTGFKDPESSSEVLPGALPPPPPDVDNAMCEHRGRKYAVGDPVKTANPCEVCRCFPSYRDRDSNPNATIKSAAINCAHVECPEGFGVPPYPADGLEKDYEKYKNCYYAHDLDMCCAAKSVCPTDAELALSPVCSYDGRNYKLGEKIFPKEDNCLTCICDDSWNSSNPTNSTCRRVQCASSPNDAKKLERGCVPIYHEKTCCAIDYHCPPPTKDPAEKEKICSEEASTGMCLAYFKRFHFNATSGQCEHFIFGGCGGTRNNFESLEHCEDFCGVLRNDSSTQNSTDLSLEGCQFNGRWHARGSSLKTDSVCVDCQCKVGPEFTCVQRSCSPPTHEGCRAHFKVGDCCPTFDCSEKKDECVVALEHKACPSANCTKTFDIKGCATCNCDDDIEDPENCPTPLCAFNCRLDLPEDSCPACVCDENATNTTDSDQVDITTLASIGETTTTEAVKVSSATVADEVGSSSAASPRPAPTTAAVPVTTTL